VSPKDATNENSHRPWYVGVPTDSHGGGGVSMTALAEGL
jgi:hypothetical protein